MKTDAEEAARLVRCPTCGAFAGDSCKSRRLGQPVKAHNDRITRAKARRIRGA